MPVLLRQRKSVLAQSREHPQTAYHYEFQSKLRDVRTVAGVVRDPHTPYASHPHMIFSNCKR